MKYILKDITTLASPAIIIHDVNCQKIMRSAITKAIHEKWPKVTESYMQFHEDDMFLGKVGVVEIHEQLFILNCWTQENYANTIHASTVAIEICLNAVIKFSIEKNIKNIYSPKIGCGLGGLNWPNDVEPIFHAVEQKYQNRQITICHLN